MGNKIVKKIALTLVMSLFIIVAFLLVNFNPNIALKVTASLNDGTNGKTPLNIKALAVKAYPNPSSDYANILFNLAEDDNIELFVTDIVGKTTNYVYLASFYKGENSIMLATGNMAVGTYIVTVTGTKVKGTVKLIVMR